MEQSNRWTRSREWLVLFSVGTGGVSTVHGSMCCGTVPKQHQRVAVGGSLVHRMCRISWVLRSLLWDVQLDSFTGNVERIALWHWENCVKIHYNKRLLENIVKNALLLCVWRDSWIQATQTPASRQLNCLFHCLWEGIITTQHIENKGAVCSTKTTDIRPKTSSLSKTEPVLTSAGGQRGWWLLNPNGP